VLHWPSRQSKDFPDKHDVIIRYSKSENYLFNKDDEYLLELDKRGKLPEDWWADVAII